VLFNGLCSAILVQKRRGSPPIIFLSNGALSDGYALNLRFRASKADSSESRPIKRVISLIAERSCSIELPDSIDRLDALGFGPNN
jgi:hypothetical protein